MRQPLHARNGRIYAGSDPITLRGVNWGWWKAREPGDAELAKSLGFDSVRICFYWRYAPGSGWDSYDSARLISSNHLSELDECIASSRSAGLRTCLAVFSQGDRGGRVQDDPSWAASMRESFWDPSGHRHDQFMELWRRLASRYKGSLDMVELINEPRPVGISDSELKTWWKECASAVRDQDPDPLILVGGTEWGSESSIPDEGLPVEGSACAVHCYTHSNLSDVLEKASTSQMPILMTELGTVDHYAAGLRSLVGAAKLLESHGVGWFLWNMRQPPGTLHGFLDGCPLKLEALRDMLSSQRVTSEQRVEL